MILSPCQRRPRLLPFLCTFRCLSSMDVKVLVTTSFTALDIKTLFPRSCNCAMMTKHACLLNTASIGMAPLLRACRRLAEQGNYASVECVWVATDSGQIVPGERSIGSLHRPPVHQIGKRLVCGHGGRRLLGYYWRRKLREVDNTIGGFELRQMLLHHHVLLLQLLRLTFRIIRRGLCCVPASTSSCVWALIWSNSPCD